MMSFHMPVARHLASDDNLRENNLPLSRGSLGRVQSMGALSVGELAGSDTAHAFDKTPQLGGCLIPSLDVEAVFLTAADDASPQAFAKYQAEVSAHSTPGLMRAKAALAKVPMVPAPEGVSESDKPTVGILFSEWFQLGSDSLANVIDLVKAHGCRPLLILPQADALVADDQSARLSAIDALNQQLDGVIALGGPDMDPSIYGQKNEKSVHVNFPRDRFDASFLLNAVLSQRMYLFAICRSHQLMNAALGGELIQDMRSAGYCAQSRNQHDYHVPTDQPFEIKDEQGVVVFSHKVDVERESDAGQIVEQSPLLTNSFHHQAVVSPGKNLKVVGSIHDGKVKKRTIEMTEAWQVITTQFHPERLLSSSVFEKLAGTACRRAHVFFQHKRDQWQSPEAGIAWMKRFEGPKPFLPADVKWLSQNFMRFRA